MTFFGLLVLNIMDFIEWLEIFVVSPKSQEVFVFFLHSSKASLFVPNGLYVPLLEMKLGKFWFYIAFLLGFLLIGLYGRGLDFKPFSSCRNLCTYMALFISRASRKFGKLSSLGLISVVMDSMMGSL